MSVKKEVLRVLEAPLIDLLSSCHHKNTPLQCLLCLATHTAAALVDTKILGIPFLLVPSIPVVVSSDHQIIET